ncbi:MAG: hypothetical protein EOO60_03725 [Hymenobacter sp.]|nr:MAG: hypothetical protein EOO60_03725 [Hymenobacter sp.]
MLASNHAKRLKRLQGLTPYEFVCPVAEASYYFHPRPDPAHPGTIHLDHLQNPLLYPTYLTPGLYT